MNIDAINWARTKMEVSLGNEVNVIVIVSRFYVRPGEPQLYSYGASITRAVTLRIGVLRCPVI